MDTCSLCEHLKIEFTKNGFKPRCNKNRFKYEERIRVDWKNDKDINERKCDEFEKFKES